MKLNRTYLFIAVSSIALIIVLVIQVNWIFQTAKIKEELFNEKANIVLARTTDALLSDTETCQKIEACMDEDSSSQAAARIGKNEIHKIDSLLRHYMNFYNFHVGYSFEVIKPQAAIYKNAGIFKTGKATDQAGCYQMPLEEMTTNNGIELKLIFPEKKQFIIAEMGPLFITSVILILIVLVLFWRTILSLVKEKRIAQHTTGFLNNMTHEFKTPLTNIALAGKMIVKDSMIKQEDKIKYYSGIILEENEKLRLQVEQFLSMTALERDEIPLHKNPLDFHHLIHNAVKCISIQIENAQGEIKINFSADQFMVIGDKTHLTNALCNLIDNAIKYSKGKPELAIETTNKGEKLIVVISDNGIGIEKHYQEKVFDKFFRVPTGDVHDVKGFGLGLAYVKKIIELHDGTIELHSEKGNGTTFIITLPNA